MQKKRQLPKCPINFAMKIKTYCLLVLLPLLITSCGTAKKTTHIEEASAKEIIAAHAAAAPEFNTLAARVQLVYETEEKMQSITVSLRMEKNKNIWIKASLLGITIAKVQITPTRVSYYETIGKTYFEGDFALLGDWLGTPINFQQAQSMLLGQSIFTLNPSKYAVDIFQNKFKILPKNQPQNFIHSLFIYPENFKIASETLSQPNEERMLNIRYGDYQNIDGQFYPSSIMINTSEKGAATKIEINYKKIDLNVDVSFPFNIPEGYDQIQLH